MKFLEDKFLMVYITVAIMVLYCVTKDGMLGEMMKYTLGATFGMFTGSQRSLIVSGADTQTKAIIAEFVKT